MRSQLSTVYLGLGSNVGERRRHLSHALAQLRELGRLSGLSGVYETAPEGFLRQPPFLNLVVRLETRLRPFRLLEEIRVIEEERGRVRPFPNAPRTLDIDILLFGDEVVERDGLSIPHPRVSERAFVLVPLVELEPSLVDPCTGRPYAEYLADLEPDHGGDEPGPPGIRRIMDAEELWNAAEE